MSQYITNFKNSKSIIEDYQAPEDALDGAMIHLAWYGYGDYCGSSLVIFERDGKLYEVNGSHCSCYGLEGQWEPEETSWEALAKRKIYHRPDGHQDGWQPSTRHRRYDGWEEANKALHELVNAQINRKLVASNVSGRLIRDAE